MRGVAPLMVLTAVAGVPAPARGAQCPDASRFDAVQRRLDALVPCAGPRRAYQRKAKRAVDALGLAAPCRTQFIRERVIRSVCGRAGVICCRAPGNGRGASAVARTTRACGKSGVVCPGTSVGAACDPAGGCLPAPIAAPSTACEARCPNDPASAGLPRQLCASVPLPDPATGSNGSDLDIGSSGVSHDLAVPGGATLRYCLRNCDGIHDTLCDASGDTGPGSLNGETFGAPQPLIVAGLPVCVVNHFRPGSITGTFDLASGAGGEGPSGPNVVELFNSLYLRPQSLEICPRCIVPEVATAAAIGRSGTCSQTSSTPGASCVVDGFVTVAGAPGDPGYTLSTSCLPQERPVGTLHLPLRLTTGSVESAPGPRPCADSGQGSPDRCHLGRCDAPCTVCRSRGPDGECIGPLGGIAQTCCSGGDGRPCFATSNGGRILRSGERGTRRARYASVFCIPFTGTDFNDPPGPGALLLPFDPITVLFHTR